MAKRKTTARKRVAKTKKKSSFNWTAVAAVLAVALLGSIYYINSYMAPNVNDNGGSNPPSVISGDGSAITAVQIGGVCEKDSQCFLTYCKGQEKACVNTTQWINYSKNCGRYSDWVTEGNNTVCSCVQNSCTMLK